MIIHDLAAMVMVLISLSGVTLLLHHLQTRMSIHPELVRKILHTTMGLICLSFPWLFQSPYTVWALAVVAGIGLTAIKRRGENGSGPGSVLCAVKRKSFGEVSFAAAVAILFSLTRDNPMLYCVPVLILTTADSLSALVGVFMGKLRYTTMDGTKTAEGSLAFFAAACVLTTGWLLLLTPLGTEKSWLVGILLGGLVTLFEAASWRGFDNFFVPLSSYFLLNLYTSMDSGSLLSRLAIVLFLLILTFAVRKRTTLDDSAVLAACLCCYGFTAIGGLAWAIAPLTVLIAHKLLLPPQFQNSDRKHTVYGVLAVSAGGFLWLAAGRMFNADTIFPFTLSFAANLAIIGIAHLRSFNQESIGLNSFAVSTGIISWLLMFIPYVLIKGATAEALLQSLAGLPLVLLACIVFHIMGMGKNERASSKLRWFKQSGAAILVSPLSLFF